MNPLGTRATSFRVPTKEELSHDFLWRIHQQSPAHGTVQIFNRSHYEDILVPTVEKLFDKKVIEKRYDQINNFEDMLQKNGTTIVKFYLNVSKDKQKEKLNERLTDPTKYWKHNIGDRDTRDNYDEYINVYENIFNKCDKPEWNIIAADQNRYKIYQISKILLKVFEEMELRWPKLSPDQETSYLKAKAELAEHKDEKQLAKQKAKLAKKQTKQDLKDKQKAAKEKSKNDKKMIKKNNQLAKKQAQKDKKTEIRAAKQKAKLAKQKVNTHTPQLNTKATPTKRPVAIVKKSITPKKTVTTNSGLIKTPTLTKQTANK